MKDPIRKVKFIPRFSAFTKVSKVIGFDIANNFDFSSIKNIITIKFVTPKVKTIINFFAKTFVSKIKFRKQITKAMLSILASAKVTVQFATYAKPIIRLYVSFKDAVLTFTNNVSARVKLFAQVQFKVKFAVVCNESFKLILCGVAKIKFVESAKAHVKIYSEILNNKFRFASEVDANIKLFAKLQEFIGFKNKSKANIVLNAQILENDLNFITSASAIAYKPMKMQSIYDIRMEDLYYKSMEEIFYGQILE